MSSNQRIAFAADPVLHGNAPARKRLGSCSIGLEAVVVAMGLGIMTTLWAARRIQNRVRADEAPLNESIEAPADNATKWHVVHIRDDISGIFTMLAITNGLLAAILTVLVFVR
jgi:hypothetical protein